MKRYDGTLAPLEDRSHSHPNQHTPEEIRLIDNMRRRNPNAGLVVFWGKLRQKGYRRSISGLYRFLRKRGQMAVKPPNPKYIPSPYEQMDHPGQRMQIDVKFVPASCLVGEAAQEAKECGGHYQYTFLDEYSRFRILEAFKEHSTYSSAEFIRHCVKKFPCPIECVRTDNGSEFTDRIVSGCSRRETLFEATLRESGIRHKLIRPYTTAKWNAVTARTTRASMQLTSSSPLRITKPSSPVGTERTTISPCVLYAGGLPSRCFLRLHFVFHAIVNPTTSKIY